MMKLFAKLLRAYLDCSMDARGSIHHMIDIINTPGVDPSDCMAAMDTVAEFLAYDGAEGDGPLAVIERRLQVFDAMMTEGLIGVDDYVLLLEPVNKMLNNAINGSIKTNQPGCGCDT